MKILTRSIIILMCMIRFSAQATKHDDAVIVIQKKNYKLLIRKEKFAFSFQDAEGGLIANFHQVSGINFGLAGEAPQPAIRSTEALASSDSVFSCVIENAGGLKAVVTFNLSDRVINLRITPEKNIPGAKQLKYIIEARTAGLGPVYGLGDHGSYGESTNLFGYSNNNLMNTSDKSRFVSTFCVFPKQQFAQVVFERASKRVGISQDENKLGANDVAAVNIYYFIGSMHSIYADYAKARAAEGYPDFKPKYDFFDLGYEAFGSLGWNTAQSTVQKDLTEYMKRGYPLRWAVVGSGFWKGDRKSPSQGSTNSFGIWDDTFQPGRTDDLPNPRYPDVAGFKKYFRNNNLNLILGIRVNYKAPVDQGGYNDPVNDGQYTNEGIKKGYFVKDADGKPKVFSAVFPKGSVYILNGANPAAVKWFYDGSKKWGAMGYKEDTMIKDGHLVMDDGKANSANEILMRNGYCVMVRNSSYSVPGEIIRIEDTQHGQNQDRPLINVLSFAASAAPNTYPDIVGGKYHSLPLKEDVKRYYVRNALFAAVCPAMSLGLGPWHLENPAYEAVIKKATDWHHEFAPYIYSSALESYYSGFPTTMTPLPIAFPKDTATYDLASKKQRQFSWMLGPSMLAAPAYGDDYATAVSRDVYLPEGIWIDYESGKKFSGPCLLEDYAFPDGKIPVFIGAKGILVKKSGDNGPFRATVYPVSNANSSYKFYYPDGKSESVIKTMGVNWKNKIAITDEVSKKRIKPVYSETFHSYTFPILKGHYYTIQNE